jgi:hypothetical protein
LEEKQAWMPERQSAPLAGLEHAARTSFEHRHGQALKDEEWIRYRERLKEFIRLLAIWDSEQPKARKTAEEKELAS